MAATAAAARPESPSDQECGPSDMRLHSNGNTVSTCTNVVSTPICSSRLPSPLNSEPVPGPSNMPPVQQVPLVSISSSRYSLSIQNPVLTFFIQNSNVK